MSAPASTGAGQAVPTGSSPVEQQLDADGLYRPSPLEVTLGHLHDGGGPGPAPAEPLRRLVRQRPAPRGTAARALERVLAGHLAAGPCVVAFSGGRDSSGLLALAARTAAREGLDPPVAATQVFDGLDGAEAADERGWQEAVLDHLARAGTPVEHVRLPSARVFDLLGDTTADALRRHGLVWPALVHTGAPLWRLAAGGTVVTGQGGDEVVAGQRCGPLALARRRRGAPHRVAAGVALALAPARVRVAASARRGRATPRPPWLTPAGLDLVDAGDRAAVAAQPLGFADALAAHRRDRGFALYLATETALAAGHGARTAYPFFDPAFLGALAAEGAPFGFGNRTSAMVRLFDEVLPKAVLHRTSKGRFHGPAFGERSRAFARSWSGGGLDTDLVDAEALRADWLGPRPWAGTMLALHAAWLHDAGLPQHPAGTSPGPAAEGSPRERRLAAPPRARVARDAQRRGGAARGGGAAAALAGGHGRGPGPGRRAGGAGRRRTGRAGPGPSGRPTPSGRPVQPAQPAQPAPLDGRAGARHRERDALVAAGPGRPARLGDVPALVPGHRPAPAQPGPGGAHRRGPGSRGAAGPRLGRGRRRRPGPHRGALPRHDVAGARRSCARRSTSHRRDGPRGEGPVRVRAHGLVVDSDVDLSLDRPTTDAPDVVVRRHAHRPVGTEVPAGRVLARLVLGGRVRFALVADGAGLVLHFAAMAVARVDAGATRVDLHLDPAVDPGMAAILVNGYVMTVVLKARGHQVLHATAYAAGGRAVALVGSSGMGKSTSGVMACRAGAALVSDDVLRVAPAPGGGWVCWPGTTESRLRPAAAALAEPDAGAPRSGPGAGRGEGPGAGARRGWRARTRATSDGRHAVTPGAPDGPGGSDLATGAPLPLVEVLVPAPSREADRARFEPLTGAAALVELSRHPRLVGLEDPAWLRAEFEGLSALVRAVPVARAVLPWGPPWPAATGRSLLARTGVVDLTADPDPDLGAGPDADPAADLVGAGDRAGARAGRPG